MAHLKTVFSLFAITLFVGMIPLSAYALSPGATLVPSRPHFYDTSGARLHSVDEGRQVMITSTFTNYKEEEVLFVSIIEVRDANGITAFLSWQSSIIAPLGNKTIGVSWVVPESASYQSRAFAFTNFEHPQVLSPVESVEISATKA